MLLYCLGMKKSFENLFAYDVHTDCYVTTAGANETIMYQIGGVYIVTRYEYERGKRVYVGENRDRAMATAVYAATNI